MNHEKASKTEIKNGNDHVSADVLRRFPPLRPGPLELKFLKILQKSTGERQAHAFLKRHDFLVGMTFRSSTHTGAVVSEFEFGAEFRCDFLVLSHCSAWWSADFIELESPNSALYLADGTETRTLRVAKRQIRDWRQWAGKNEGYLRQRLSTIFTQRGTPASGAISAPDAATEILLPNCALTYTFHIVIGRREHLSPLEQSARAQDSRHGGVSIATYDRFLDVAHRYDGADKGGKEAFEYWKA